jgi:glycosyltransferase involved in cell wall biosynthesis
MRILYVSPYPPARDGIGTYTQVLAAAVRDLGHETAVLTPRPQPGSPPEVIGALGEDVLARFQPDLVHVQFAVAAFGSRTPAVLKFLDGLPVPVVATLHEVTREVALLRGPGRALYRRLADRCARVVAHTGEASRLAGDRAVVIPHFCAPPPPATVTAADLRERFGLGTSPILLAFGFIHIDKGLGDLVRALAGSGGADTLVVAGTVRRRTGLFRLLEARDRVHEAWVRTLIRRHRLTKRVVFTGYVPDGEVAAWFDAARAVVLPYRRAAQSGVGNLALAFGVPVIATSVGGLPELFADTVPPRSPQALADALARPHRCARQPGPGPADIAARTVAVYEGVLAGVV